MTASPATNRARRAALVFIFVTVLIDVLSFGLIIPVLPHLVEQFVGGDTSPPRTGSALRYRVRRDPVRHAPVQGALSDRFGRRPVILLSCLGLGLDFVFMALAPSLAWLLVGRIIRRSPRPASPPPTPTSPTSRRRQRAKSFGMIGAAFGVGFIIGPLLGGVLGTSTYACRSGSRPGSRC